MTKEERTIEFLRFIRDDPNLPMNFQADIDQFLGEVLGVWDD